MTNYLLGYFILSAVVCAWIAIDSASGIRRLGWAVLQAALAPLLVPATWASELWEWLESHAQAKTFWYFLFNRKRMIRTAEELELMHSVTLRHKATGSIYHRLWRLAERFYFIVNDSRPPVS